MLQWTGMIINLSTWRWDTYDYIKISSVLMIFNTNGTLTWYIGEIYPCVHVVGWELGEFLDLEFRDVEEWVRAQSWLDFDKMGKKDKNTLYWRKQFARKLWTALVFIIKEWFWWVIWWLFSRETMWAYLILIGKRKVLIWGCKGERKKRNLCC